MPAGAAGLVGPNPVPHRIMMSPGFAATVVAPANVPAFAAKEKFCRVATAWLPGHKKNAGPCAIADTAVNALLAAPATATVTDTGPAPTSGTKRLIWVGLT